MPKPPEAEIKGAGKAAGGTKPKSGIRYANGGFTHAVPAKIRLPIRCYNPSETDDTKKEHLMNTPQSAIIPDHAQAGIFIEADFAANRLNDIKAACRASLDALSALKTRFPDDILGLTIAFGSKAWATFGHADEGSEIKPFSEMGNGLAPSTQHDMSIHIQSFRQNAAYALAQSVLGAFGDSICVASEEHGLRLYQDRGLDGFVDGTENPQGDENVREVAIIPEGKPDAGGSYVLLQKYLHDLKKWDAVPVAEQEASVGRGKETDDEFGRDVRLPDSHLGRVNLKENGVGLKIVRRSLPFGKISGEHGLMFTAYCRTLHNIEAQLLSMFGDTDGKTDLLLRHLSAAVSGGYYYAPSVERLQNL